MITLAPEVEGWNRSRNELDKRGWVISGHTS